MKDLNTYKKSVMPANNYTNYRYVCVRHPAERALSCHNPHLYTPEPEELYSYCLPNFKGFYILGGSFFVAFQVE